MEIQTENQKEMLVIENTETEMKNALDGFINKLDTAVGRISELEKWSVENSKTEMQRGNKQ